MNDQTPLPRKPWYLEPPRIALVAFLGIGGYFLVTEHWAHVVPWLPWLFLAACPLLHIFMHRGHGGHGGHGSHDGQRHQRRSQSSESSPRETPGASTTSGGDGPNGHEHHHGGTPRGGRT